MEDSRQWFGRPALPTKERGWQKDTMGSSWLVALQKWGAVSRSAGWLPECLGSCDFRLSRSSTVLHSFNAPDEAGTKDRGLPPAITCDSFCPQNWKLLANLSEFVNELSFNPLCFDKVCVWVPDEEAEQVEESVEPDELVPEDSKEDMEIQEEPWLNHSLTQSSPNSACTEGFWRIFKRPMEVIGGVPAEREPEKLLQKSILGDTNLRPSRTQ